MLNRHAFGTGFGGMTSAFGGGASAFGAKPAGFGTTTTTGVQVIFFAQGNVVTFA
jgi:hypothetical protein